MFNNHKAGRTALIKPFQWGLHHFTSFNKLSERRERLGCVFTRWSYGCVLLERVRYGTRSSLRLVSDGFPDRRELAVCAQVNESEILHGILPLEMQMLKWRGGWGLWPLLQLYLGLRRPGQRPGRQEGWGGQHSEHSTLHSGGAAGGSWSSHLEGETGTQRKGCGGPRSPRVRGQGGGAPAQGSFHHSLVGGAR